MKIANPSENGCKSVFFLPQFHNGEYFVFENILTFAHFLDRGDYMKMRRFFEGPKWVKEKDISYAPSADTEFRRKMSEFYPGICEFMK